jgi:hypothetical protein
MTQAGEPLGGHLATMTLSDAIARVETLYGSNSGTERRKGSSIGARKDIIEFKTIEDFAEHLNRMLGVMEGNLTAISDQLSRKDRSYDSVKNALAKQLVEQRKRDEGVYV